MPFVCSIILCLAFMGYLAFRLFGHHVPDFLSDLPPTYNDEFVPFSEREPKVSTDLIVRLGQEFSSFVEREGETGLRSILEYIRNYPQDGSFDEDFFGGNGKDL